MALEQPVFVEGYRLFIPGNILTNLGHINGIRILIETGYMIFVHANTIKLTDVSVQTEMIVFNEMQNDEFLIQFNRFVGQSPQVSWSEFRSA